MITNYAANYAAATTTVTNTFEELFNRPRAQIAKTFCEEIPVKGLTLEAPFLGDTAPVRQWVGSKFYQAMRSFKSSYPVLPYERSLRIEAIKLRQDQSGAIGRRVAAWVASTVTYFEKPIFDLLLSNPTGFDGVALVSTSHPFAPAGGTQSNKTANALSHSEYRAGIKAMAGWLAENSEPLEMSASVLIVGPDQEDIALEVTGATKPTNVTNAGAIDGTSNVVSNTTIGNVYEGRTTVIVSPRMTTGKWVIMDLTKPGLRPIVMGLARAPEPIVVDDPRAYQRFENDDWVASIEADFALGAGLWPTIYGNL